MSDEKISIHALREEGDHHADVPRLKPHKISIHALREEGDNDLHDAVRVVVEFLSTPSARRATTVGDPSGPESVFLSTPSARRATRGMRRGSPGLRNFYPRPPRGGRRGGVGVTAMSQRFLSTPSARRATGQRRRVGSHRLISIHALREEGDSKNRDKISIFKQIIQHSARI